jgi:hypothetical protein
MDQQVVNSKLNKSRGQDTATAKGKSKTKRATSKRRAKRKPIEEVDYDVDVEGDLKEIDEEPQRISFNRLDLTASSSNFVNLNECTLLVAVPTASVWKADKEVSVVLKEANAS